MGTALLKAELASHLNTAFRLQEQTAPETILSGIPQIDSRIGGIPRGCVTEIFGPASSGRASLLLAFMAQATAHEEVCVLVDATNAFDPASASAAGVDLGRLLWIRCGGNTEHALKATDLLVQAGGFGVVVMDLGDVPLQTARRISLASWFRLRRAVEHTPTALIIIERSPHAMTCASLVLEMRTQTITWSGASGCSHLLRSLKLHIERRKPMRPTAADFEARVAG